MVGRQAEELVKTDVGQSVQKVSYPHPPTTHHHTHTYMYPHIYTHTHTTLYPHFQGAEIVREDLLDDIVKESGPYQSPERIGTRTEMASSYSPSAPTQENTISPNE